MKKLVVTLFLLMTSVTVVKEFANPQTCYLVGKSENAGPKSAYYKTYYTCENNCSNLRPRVRKGECVKIRRQIL